METEEKVERDEKMVLKDLPVNTRNYVIIDNITGKPIDQSNYALTIDKEVITKLNKLKRVNEEKVKQSSLKEQYSTETLVETFTPQDSSVFAPVYEGEYIDYRDFVMDEDIQTEENKEEKETFAPIEVIQQDKVLDRVVPRERSVTTEEKQPINVKDEIGEENMAEINENEKDVYIPEDNSTFNPEDMGLDQASKQIINIEVDKLGSEIKPVKERKVSRENISLDKVEIKQAKGFAWLAYLLFFIPLLINKKNRFARMHANEGLELNIMEIVGAVLILPIFLFREATDITQTIVTVCALLGCVLLLACALTIIPMMITAMCGATFQIPWLWKKRIIKVDSVRS